MPDPQLARAELAKRELARRESTQQPQAQSKPMNPLQMTGDIMGKAVSRLPGAGMFNSITGGPATELAHQVKSIAGEKSGMTPLVSEALSMATDPQQLLGGAAALKSGAGAMQAGRMMKARKLTTEFIKPNDKEASALMKQGKFTPGVEEGVKSITKTGSHRELVGKLNPKLDELNSKVRAHININNNPVDRSYMQPLLDFKKELIGSGQAPANAEKVIDDIIQNEINHQNKLGQFSRMDAHNRKIELSELANTEGLTHKRITGTLSPDDAIRDQALDKLRFGLRQAVENGIGGDDIKALNAQYGSRSELIDDIASQGIKSEKATPPPNIFQRIRPFARLNNMLGGEPNMNLNVSNNLSGTGKGAVKKTTSKIEKLSGRKGTVSELLKLIGGNK